MLLTLTHVWEGYWGISKDVGGVKFKERKGMELYSCTVDLPMLSM